MELKKIYGFFLVKENDFNAIVIDMIEQYNCKIMPINKTKEGIMIMCYE